LLTVFKILQTIVSWKKLAYLNDAWAVAHYNAKLDATITSTEKLGIA